MTGLLLVLAITPMIGLPRDEPRGTFDATGQCSGAPTEQCASAQATLVDRAPSCKAPAQLRNRASAASTRAILRADLRHADNPQGQPIDPSCQKAYIRCLNLPSDTLQTTWRATSAVWNVLENKVIMPCILQSKLFAYDTRTGQITVITQSDMEDPVVVRRYLDELVVEHGEGVLMVHSTDLNDGTPINLLTAKNATWSIGAIRDWYYRGTEVIAFADIVPTRCLDQVSTEDCTKEWRFSLVRISLRPQLSFETLVTNKVGEPAWQYALLANSYITELEGVVYALMPGQPTRVIRVDSGQAVHEAVIDSSLGAVFDLSGQRKANVKRLFSYVRESLTQTQAGEVFFPLKLFGWNGRLYILYETAELDDGGQKRAVWKLARIDPTDSYRIIGTPMDLPTTSSRILLLPGRCHWAIVEHRDRDADVERPEIQTPKVLKILKFQDIEY